MWANSFLFALPQLFIIHQRSGFIIQYSFVPTYHPACPFRQYRADGNVCGRLIASPTGGAPSDLKIAHSKPRAVGANCVRPFCRVIPFAFSGNIVQTATFAGG